MRIKIRMEMASKFIYQRDKWQFNIRNEGSKYSKVDSNTNIIITEVQSTHRICIKEDWLNSSLKTFILTNNTYRFHSKYKQRKENSWLFATYKFPKNGTSELGRVDEKISILYFDVIAC